MKLLILYYFRFLAQLQLQRIKPKIVGVTGSVGKSTACAAIYTILASPGLARGRAKYKVHYSEHANSESGIPLDILGLSPNNYSILDWMRLVLLAPISLFRKTPDYEIYLAEMGIDSPKWPKNMDFLLSIFNKKVDVGVFLNAHLVHSENFKNLEEIIIEKKKLVNNAINKVIVNEDELAKLNIKDTQVNFWAAKQVAQIFNIPPSVSEKILKTNFHLPPGRMTIIPGINESIILDSSYNASKSSMLWALESLASYKNKRKIALLGDMRELGEYAKQEHEEVAKKALKTADETFTVGPLTKKYFPVEVRNFENSYEAGLYLKDFIKKDDVILIKGSQNTIFLETAVEMLMAHPEDADKLLCRRGDFWEKKRDDTL
ncbi:MAG: cyanophycin synthetase [Patescibacteria group bacterium]